MDGSDETAEQNLDVSGNRTQIIQSVVSPSSVCIVLELQINFLVA